MQLIRTLLLSLLLGASALFAQSPATQVLASLTVKDGITRDQIMKVMPGEVRATVQLYLDGHIQQWYSRADGKGVMFILNCKSVAEAKELMDSLPLSKAGFATFEYTGIAPLKPLQMLIAPPAQ